VFFIEVNDVFSMYDVVSFLVNGHYAVQEYILLTAKSKNPSGNVEDSMTLDVIFD